MNFSVFCVSKKQQPNLIFEPTTTRFSLSLSPCVFRCSFSSKLTRSLSLSLSPRQTSQPICRDFQNGRCFRSRYAAKRFYIEHRERGKAKKNPFDTNWGDFFLGSTGQPRERAVFFVVFNRDAHNNTHALFFIYYIILYFLKQLPIFPRCVTDNGR